MLVGFTYENPWNNATMRFGQVLMKAGVVHRHTEYGNVYRDG
ncbi:DUF3874 domain-containing protein [Bacteroides sp.]|nr:DUF3874 domain-containing protein [Bacteroides sp.]